MISFKWTARGVTLWAVTLWAALAPPAPAQSVQTLTLDFAPPDMAVQPICQARAPDADLTAVWRKWDGLSLSGRDPGLITRDLRRLAEIDALAWDDTIQKAILALAKASPKFTPDDVLLARIGQMIATGRLQDLAKAGLVAKVLAHADDTSSRTQFVLSGLLSDGTGIAKDAVRAGDLLVSAGYAGNADALLALTRLTLAGQSPAGWDIPPDLAVTMAFGALVGQMDPLICDRIARIAREYTAGTTVTIDHAMALRWYRFAADLGDPVSAWRVVEYHLQSELVTKDNAVLMTYLHQAAKGGLPYAMVALGRILEVGALAPQDIPAAQALYQRAAALGDHAALVRFADFLEPRLNTQPDLRPLYIATLQHLTAQPNAPGWAFAKQAEMILEDQGRWQGQTAARPLLEEAAKRQDPSAVRALADAAMGTAQTDAQFYAALDPLIQLVSNLGDGGSVSAIESALLCKAPDAPHLGEVAYWQGVDASIGAAAPDISPAELDALTLKADPQTMAALQSHALAGQTTSLADMLAVLDRTHAPASATAYWVNAAADIPAVTSTIAQRDLSRAKTPAAREAAFALFRKALGMGDMGAAMKLAAGLLQQPDLANRTQALALLEPLADQGLGAAMSLLQIADPARFPTAAATYAVYAKVIAARGDFSALLFGMPFLTDPAQQDLYRARATEVMGCDFPEAIAFSNVWATLGNDRQARRWLAVAAELTGNDPWQMVVLGDAQLALLGHQGVPMAAALYEKSNAMGSKTAVQRLLALYAVRGAPDYDAARAADLYVTLIARSDPVGLPDLLAELTRRNPALAVTVGLRLDLDALYQKAAEAGNPAAMREHARRLAEAATKPAERAAATDWLRQAAEAGDAPAMVLLSQSYAFGVGVALSQPLAQRWLQRAAEAGDAGAMDLVTRMATQGVSN